MRLPLILVLVTIASMTTVAGSSLAHEGDEPHDDHYDGHMGGWDEFPLLGMGIIGYMIMALPIALLVHIDARERGANVSIWPFLVLVPWVGLLAALAYVVVRTMGPRTGPLDPEVDGTVEGYPSGRAVHPPSRWR
jgi:hypothetical protein